METGVTPITVGARRRAMVSFEKAMRGREDDPRRILCSKTVTKRLVRNKGWRDQARKECDKVLQGKREDIK